MGRARSGIGKGGGGTAAHGVVQAFSGGGIVFPGVGRRVGCGVSVGDIVVAQDYVQHDMDVSPLFERWCVPGYDGVRLPCDPTLTAILSEAVESCLVSARAVSYTHMTLPTNYPV